MTAGATAFDGELADQLGEAMDHCDVEAHGRALARKCDRFTAAVEDAARVANEDAGLLMVAGAMDTAMWAADQAHACAQAVVALLGTGDVSATTRALEQSRRARRVADRVRRRWDAMRKARGEARA